MPIASISAGHFVQAGRISNDCATSFLHQFAGGIGLDAEMLHTLDLTGLADQNAWRLSGQFATSLLSGVRAVGEHLARHFPARSGKPNEMPDRPVVLR